MFSSEKTALSLEELMALSLKQFKKRLLMRAAKPRDTREIPVPEPAEEGAGASGTAEKGASKVGLVLLELESQHVSPAAAAETVKRETAAGADEAASVGQLAQSVSKIFEPMHVHQQRMGELARAFDSTGRAMYAALGTVEPMENFRALISRLSDAFEAMKSFQTQIGALAETFGTVKPLKEQMLEFGEAFHTNLTQLANELEPAEKLRVEAVRLVELLSTVCGLQAEFLRLSDSFRLGGDGGSGGRGPASPGEDHDAS